MRVQGRWGAAAAAERRTASRARRGRAPIMLMYSIFHEYLRRSYGVMPADCVAAGGRVRVGRHGKAGVGGSTVLPRLARSFFPHGRKRRADVGQLLVDALLLRLLGLACGRGGRAEGGQRWRARAGVRTTLGGGLRGALYFPAPPHYEQLRTSEMNVLRPRYSAMMTVDRRLQGHGSHRGMCVSRVAQQYAACASAGPRRWLPSISS